MLPLQPLIWLTPNSRLHFTRLNYLNIAILTVCVAIIDDLTAPQDVMTARIPKQQARTLFARIGNLFTWNCAVVLFAMLIWVLN